MPEGADVDKPSGVRSEIAMFVRNVESISSLAPVVMMMVNAATDVAQERFLVYAQEYGIEKDEQDGARAFLFEPPHHMRAARLRRRLDEVTAGHTLVPRSFLISLVAQYDSFLGRLLKAIFLARPELLTSTDRSLNLKQLLELGTLEGARDYLLEKEIETVLRKSHAEQFDWMETRFGLKLRADLAAWPEFIELTERRNLFVHADGLVSEQYLAVCRAHKCHLPDHLAKADALEVTPDYLVAAISAVFEIGVKLGQVLWRRLLPHELAEADTNLIGVSYDLLVGGHYRRACELLDFGCNTLKRHASEINKLTLTVNYAQAHKWRGDESRCRSILAEKDWVATRADFQLCVAVLEDRFDDAATLMKRMGAAGEIGEADFQEWPLFRKFRNSKEFLAAYEVVFGKPFVHLETVFREREKKKLASLEPLKQEDSEEVDSEEQEN